MSEFDNQNVNVYGQYNQQPVDPNQPPVDPNQPQKKGFAIASLVLGIVSIVPCCCIPYIGVILAALAIVFAILFLNANKGLMIGKGMAMAGLILGIIGVVVCVGMLIFSAVTMSSGNYQDMVNEIVNSIESQQ